MISNFQIIIFFLRNIIIVLIKNLKNINKILIKLFLIKFLKLIILLILSFILSFKIIIYYLVN